MLARLINAADLRQACLELKKRGFDTTWSFTANTLASWIYLHCKSPYAFSGAWDAVKQDRTLEAMLLPPLAASATSWFSREPRPARVSPSVSAHATAVAALMRAAAATGVESPQWSAFAEGLLKSTFGDPRRPPESTGWRALRARDEPAYLWFLERLITEDITVFFEHAMNDRRRKAFWLRYLRSVRRTVCILNQVVHERLTVRLAGSDAKLAAAMSRALKFAGPNSGAQAFCLYFDTLVVVEFSDEGNAAYVYDRTVFEKHFERDIFSGQCRGHKDLKSVPLAGNRRIRHAGDWEHAAASDLASSRIHPDRR